MIQMHPFISQQMAQQHMKDLQHEVEVDQVATQMNKAGSTHYRWDNLGFLRDLYVRTRLMYRRQRRPVAQQTTRAEEVSLEEIKPAVLTTFSVMREVGLVSEYDDQFIEKFVQTLEEELAQQAKCHSV
jgi:hypothetical protein